ncbi:PH domain-containing protein [Streptomyces sp. NPDC003077]|uniref:PH domain-containing protein n=1 Tax=Streptomyces sp. NPDC003077 TaxID=3154443 RepID=UPI0033A62E9D
MSATAPAPSRPATDTPWHRPSPRALLVPCQWLLPPLGSLALTALATGGRLRPGAWIPLACVAAAFGVLTAAGVLRWFRTGYRVTADTFELRGGLFARRLRTVPLSRIRSVDLTASPAHRLLRLAVLRAGTAGSADGTELSLDALTTPDAERLRALLLARTTTRATAPDPLLARLDWRWLRYAPLTFWVLGGVLTATGTVYRVLDGVGIELWKVGLLRDAFTEFGHSFLWLTVPAALLAVLALGSAGALALYAENWWNFRLEWTDRRTLRVRRGLLTARSITIERARLRGVTLSEPLLLRAGGGARVRAVAGGLGDQEENRARSAVLPPAPRTQALRVASGVLRSPFPTGPLRSHPKAALRRRRTRGLLLVVLPGTLALAVLGALLTPVLLPCAAAYALVSGLAVLWLARDAYRALGHGIAGPHLVVRSGTFHRDTHALERAAIGGWTFSSSPFSRRAGLCTLTAAVAAGEEGYHVRDLPDAYAPSFAAQVTPGLLDEFLEWPGGFAGRW